MNISNVIDSAIDLARNVAALLPGGHLVEEAIDIGDKVIDVLDTLKHHATPDQQTELQTARATLARAVEAKAHATSDRLRG